MAPAAAAFVIALFSLLALPAGASAYVAKGPAWPGGTIRYHETLPPSYSWSIAAAVRAWNTSGAKVRLVRARRAGDAQLVMRFGPTGGAAGAATVGYQRGAYLHLRRPSRGRSVVVTDSRLALARLIAHELGHVVGLEHTGARGCQLMDQYLRSRCIGGRYSWQYRCRFLFSDDLAGAIRLYGRRVPAPRARTYCNREAPPPQLRDVKASGGAADTPVTLSWTRPAGLRSTARIEVMVHSTACGSATARNRLFARDLPNRATSWTDDTAVGRAPGQSCYRLRVLNSWGLPRPMISRTVTISPAVPSPPVVHSIEPDPDGIFDYYASIDLPTADSYLIGRVAPAGACATSLDQGTELEIAAGGSPYPIDGVPETGSWCLSFFAVRSAAMVSSQATTTDVTRP